MHLKYGTSKDKSKPTDEFTIKKFEKNNKIVKGHLLYHVTNSLLNLFVIFKSIKTIWERLDVKYGADDAGKKKYMVSEWLQF